MLNKAIGYQIKMFIYIIYILFSIPFKYLFASDTLGSVLSNVLQRFSTLKSKIRKSIISQQPETLNSSCCYNLRTCCPFREFQIPRKFLNARNECCNSMKLN